MKRERIIEWAEALTEDQMRMLVVNIVEDAIDSETIRFAEGQESPSWEHTGEPIVFGQTTWPDD